MFINLLLPNYPLLQINNNSVEAANRLIVLNYLLELILGCNCVIEKRIQSGESLGSRPVRQEKYLLKKYGPDLKQLLSNDKLSIWMIEFY
jgi:hypothetical protein